MKSERLWFTSLAALLLTAFSLQPSALFAQGSLTPPGPPAPTMLTLSQIEPRTPISASPSQITISQPGSYYLTTNLTVIGGNAIVIAANNVTLNLNGFTISSTSPAPSGMAIQLGSGGPVTNVTILNGFITSGITNSASGVYGGGGFYYGIQYFNPSYNVHVKDVSVTGCYGNGINLYVGNGGVVESCSVMIAGQIGIQASSVSHSTAYQCGNEGIGADTASDCRGDVIGTGYGILTTTANNCYGYCTGSGYGLYANGSANNCYGYCTFKDCVVSGNSSFGISASGNNYMVTDCTVSGNNAGITLAIANNCTIASCTACANTNSAILIQGNNCIVKDCNASASIVSAGINITGSSCQIVGNTCSGNTVDGIQVSGNNCQIAGNNSSGNTRYGIYIVGGQNRVDNNNVGNNGSYGINVQTPNQVNSITRNSAPNSGYGNFPSNNDYAPIQTPTNNPASPWANFQ